MNDRQQYNPGTPLWVERQKRLHAAHPELADLRQQRAEAERTIIACGHEITRILKEFDRADPWPPVE
jgi:hypothetical protein